MTTESQLPKWVNKAILDVITDSQIHNITGGIDDLVLIKGTILEEDIPYLLQLLSLDRELRKNYRPIPPIDVHIDWWNPYQNAEFYGLADLSMGYAKELVLEIASDGYVVYLRIYQI
ncbi:MAG: hypothetical protein CUN52_05605 [Phototrophicales bacterium]|nr:MAG: hypothetical protein CUN52_05605 [Phototrophicales bacterium]